MDPWSAYGPGVKGDLDARAAYNRWVSTGGFPVVVDVRRYTRTWIRGIRRIRVMHIGSTKVRGTDYNNPRVQVKVPFAALEEVD